jgi:adenosine deaminase
MQSGLATALLEDDLDKIRSIQKSDLHNHAILGARLARIEKHFNTQFKKPPKSMKQIKELTSYTGAVLKPFINNKDIYQGFIEMSVLEAIDDGIVILDTSIDYWAQYYYKSIEELFEFLSNLKNKYKKNIEINYDLGADRSVDAKIIKVWLETGIESKLFSAIDIYGVEDAKEPEFFVPFYKKAKSAGMTCKAHLGEFGNPEDIEKALDLLELDQIQHGINASLSKNLMKRLVRHNIQLNTCPTSNIKLGVVKNLKTHPIRILFDNGVKVTINSDDILLFDRTVSEEYLALFNAGVFSGEELEVIRKNGVGTNNN